MRPFLVLTTALASFTSMGCAKVDTPRGDAASVSGRPVDAGLADVLYPQWWYPACGSAGTCDSPDCTHIQLGVSVAGGCEPSNEVVTGCVPLAAQGSNGASTYSTPNDQVIVAIVSPYTTAGLVECASSGMGVDFATCCSWVDGGFDAQ